MSSFLRVGIGLALALMGVLAVINHPIVDKFNRVVKSMGTKQTAADIEMSGFSILIGRIAGGFITLYGIGIALAGF